ncbi:hypothetical protein [Maribellus maritimus]|uniref:hypothetical protein n=1 Tax=Maribellus maritimus TaxID=2870838 RepID=UPI001EEB2FA8|nr:hypothetical protein [Maribellus maritimus]MCG6190141.1 hypothetical protein [Maribellus maritimus]
MENYSSKKDDVHYNSDGYKRLLESVSNKIETTLTLLSTPSLNVNLTQSKLNGDDKFAIPDFLSVILFGVCQIILSMA